MPSNKKVRNSQPRYFLFLGHQVPSNPKTTRSPLPASSKCQRFVLNVTLIPTQSLSVRSAGKRPGRKTLRLCWSSLRGGLSLAGSMRLAKLREGGARVTDKLVILCQPRPETGPPQGLSAMPVTPQGQVKSSASRGPQVCQWERAHQVDRQLQEPDSTQGWLITPFHSRVGVTEILQGCPF